MTPQVLRYAAFTDAGAGGNPAGVVLNADGLTPAQMLSIARTLGYSESAFVSSGGAAGHLGLRFFSPLAEVAFCGHATVATAVALADRDGQGDLRFETMAGGVDVRTETTDGTTVATLVSPPASTRPATADEIRRTLGALRWSANDLDPALPAHVAFAGNHHLVLAARSRERLADLDYDFALLGELMAEQGWTTVDLVYRASRTVFHARNPFPPGGVVEDPATGAAAAAFGGYLRDLGLVDVPGRITVLQGEDMGAPSRLLIDLDGTDLRVRVSGTATQIPSPPDDALATE
jgi:PhzF family phenazine biosynthesis protein